MVWFSRFRGDEVLDVVGCGFASQAKLGRDPIAENLVTPGHRLEFQFLVMDVFGLEALFAFVEGCHELDPGRIAGICTRDFRRRLPELD